MARRRKSRGKHSYKRGKYRSTHRRKVKRHSRRGTKRRRRTKRMKGGGARKYMMNGGGNALTKVIGYKFGDIEDGILHPLNVILKKATVGMLRVSPQSNKKFIDEAGKTSMYTPMNRLKTYLNESEEIKERLSGVIAPYKIINFNKVSFLKNEEEEKNTIKFLVEVEYNVARDDGKERRLFKSRFTKDQAQSEEWYTEEEFKKAEEVEEEEEKKLETQGEKVDREVKNVWANAEIWNLSNRTGLTLQIERTVGRVCPDGCVPAKSDG